MNVSIYLQTDYENLSDWTIGESKPNSNPIKPNFKRAKMNANVFATKDYGNETAFRPQKNKPKTNPISSKAKMNVKSLAKKSGHTLVGYPTYLTCNLV